MSQKSEEWIPCTSPEEGDFLRWVEPLFAPPSKKRGKPNKMGDQRVTAQLLSIGEFYVLDVIEAIKIAGGGTIKVKAGDQIRRKPSSIAMGDCYKKRV
jgi:hypothetical protein